MLLIVDQPEATASESDQAEIAKEIRDRNGWSRVTLEYAAVPNLNTKAGGWLPGVWEEGKRVGNTWSERDHDRETAEQIANGNCVARAERFCGDIVVVIAKRNTSEAKQ